MVQPVLIRQVLEDSSSFKRFWKDKGPFVYALTSTDFPPILLEPEEWIFSNDLTCLLKELMQFGQKKMKVVKAPFNPKNKSVLRPEQLSNWKINHFPEEWDAFECSLFVPQGHLTCDLFETMGEDEAQMDAAGVETAFFKALAAHLDELGYLLFSPRESSKWAAVHAYLSDWEADEKDAGLI